MIYSGDAFVDGPVAIGPVTTDSVHPELADAVASPSMDWGNRASSDESCMYSGITDRDELVGQILIHDIDPARGEGLIAYHLFRPAGEASDLPRFVFCRTTSGSPTSSGQPSSSRRATTVPLSDWHSSATSCSKAHHVRTLTDWCLRGWLSPRSRHSARDRRANCDVSLWGIPDATDVSQKCRDGPYWQPPTTGT